MPTWAQVLGLSAALLFVLAGAVQYGYFPSSAAGSLSGANIALLGILVAIAALAAHYWEGERGGRVRGRRFYRDVYGE